MSTLPIYKKLEDRNELDLRVEIYIDFVERELSIKFLYKMDILI